MEASVDKLLRNISFVGQGHQHINGGSRSIVSQSYIGRDGKVHTEESETFRGDDGNMHQKVKKCVDKECKTTENQMQPSAVTNERESRALIQKM